MPRRHAGPAMSLITVACVTGLLTGCSRSVSGAPVENATDAAEMRTESAARATTTVCDALTTGHDGIAKALDRDASSSELADVIQKAGDGVDAALTPKVPSDLRPLMTDYVTAATNMAEIFRTSDGDSDKVIDTYFDALQKAEDACTAHER